MARQDYVGLEDIAKVFLALGIASEVWLNKNNKTKGYFSGLSSPLPPKKSTILAEQLQQ